MDTTAVTVVTQLINEGRLRFGEVGSVEVPAQLFDEVLEEVASAGGAVGFDSCVVDGVRVQSLTADSDAQAAFHLTSGERTTLDRA